MWHFIVEEDPRDPYSFKAWIEFQKERRKGVSLCIIQEIIDYSLFHYIVEADTPKRAWNILKEVFSEEPVVEEDDFASYAKHQESHSEVEDSQDDYVYEAASDHVNPKNIVDLVVFVDDSEKKPANVTVLIDVSDSLFEKEIVDSSIEATIVAENEQ